MVNLLTSIIIVQGLFSLVVTHTFRVYLSFLVCLCCKFCTELITQTYEKKEQLSRYWNETSAAEDHTNISHRFP